MKNLMILATLTAAIVVSSLAAPGQAAGLRAKERRVQRKLARQGPQYQAKQRRWYHNHPTSTPKQFQKLLAWDRRHARKGARLERRERKLSARIAHKKHH